MSTLYGITVSTNYSDILKYILPQNYKFFTKWYIITDKNDSVTINVIKESEYPNIEILYFDFKQNNAKFNKGGALRFAQLHVLEKHGNNSNVLIVDSDIFIPDEFANIYNNMTIESDKLYGITKRFDYKTHSDFLNNKYYCEYDASKDFVGFFHLFKQTPQYLYNNSMNCAACDLEFRNFFLKTYAPMSNTMDFYKRHNCVYLNLTVSHFGIHGENWDGRKFPNSFT